MQKVLGFAMVLVSGSTLAGWFGPSNYDECLLENLKGVASDTAAVGIAKACRSKFPLPPPPPPSAEELAKEKEQRAERCRKYRQRQTQENREAQETSDAVTRYQQMVSGCDE